MTERLYIAEPSHTGDGEIGSGKSSSYEVRVQYAPEAVLAPDPISDAFGRVAAFALDGFADGMYPLIKPTEARIMDLGTGSGVFSVSLMSTLRGDHTIKIDAVDIDPTALATARLNMRNAARLSDVRYVLNFIQSDWLKKIPVPKKDKYKVIYSNPPYLEKDHPISNPEALQAPPHTIFVEDPWQEYAKILPLLPNYLANQGIALIRLPINPGGKMWNNLGEFCKSLEDPYKWMFLKIQAQKREGFGLVLMKDYLPHGFAEYDFYINYLDGVYKSHAPARDAIPFCADSFCKVERIPDAIIRQKLGIDL